MHAWDLGGVEVVDARCSAHTMRRSARQAARDDETVLAITCARRGRGVHRQLDHEFKVQPSAIWATNFVQPYVHHVTDTWTTTAKVPLRLLGVPEDLVAPRWSTSAAARWPRCSATTWQHVRQVADDINDAAAASLGTATLALARALVISVSGDDRARTRGTRRHLAAAGQGLRPRTPRRRRPRPDHHRRSEPRVSPTAVQGLRAGRPPPRAVDHRAATRTRARGPGPAESDAPPDHPGRAAVGLRQRLPLRSPLPRRLRHVATRVAGTEPSGTTPRQPPPDHCSAGLRDAGAPFPSPWVHLRLV